MKSKVANLDAQHSLIQHQLAADAQQPKKPPPVKPPPSAPKPPADVNAVVEAMASSAAV
jgi:hypothetical protein